MNKILGYIVSGVGLLGLAISTVPPLKALIPFIPQTLNTLTLMVSSLIIAGIGILLVYKTEGGSSKQPAEVPIYHGKNIVGFRRLHNK